MNSPRRLAIFGFLVLAVIALIIWFFVHSANALPRTYRNQRYGFSVQLPAGYAPAEVSNTNPPAQNGIADIIEFDPGGSVQLTISYASYASPDLTVQSLLPNYPSISDIQTQPFPIAPGETGLALDDDSAHPDQISDVWFARNGYLYQLTASGDGFSELLPIAHSLTLF
jgi:hypothetical protein